MQQKFTLSSANIASRIAFIREKQGVTLTTLGEGKASTAQSWIGGKTPRRDKWIGIAERLGVSEMLIFMGRPAASEDYAFIRRWRNDIADADDLLGASNEFREDSASYGAASGRRRPELPLAEECLAYFREFLSKADGDPVRMAWILQELHDRFPLNKWPPRRLTDSDFDAKLAAADRHARGALGLAKPDEGKQKHAG